MGDDKKPEKSFFDRARRELGGGGNKFQALKDLVTRQPEEDVKRLAPGKQQARQEKQTVIDSAPSAENAQAPAQKESRSKADNFISRFMGNDVVARMKGLSFALLFDTTGSMASMINEAQQSAVRLLKALKDEFGKDKVHTALLEFKDWDGTRDSHGVIDRTSTFGQDVVGHLNQMKACGGGDEAEMWEEKLVELAGLPWGNDMVKFALLITDAPCHDVQRSRKHIDYRDAIKTLAAKGIVVSCLYCHRCGGNTDWEGITAQVKGEGDGFKEWHDVPRQMAWIAMKTGGLCFDLRGEGTDFVDAIVISIAKQMKMTVEAATKLLTTATGQKQLTDQQRLLLQKALPEKAGGQR